MSFYDFLFFYGTVGLALFLLFSVVSLYAHFEAAVRVDNFVCKLKALKNRASESRNEACFGYAECSRFY